MSWRTLCITKRCKLEYRMGYLLVRAEDTLRIHLSEISVLIIESTAISLTAALLCELAKQKIKVVFCDEKHDPYGELVKYYGSFDSSRSIRMQIEWKQEIKDAIWQQIVRDKISKQAKVLKRYKHNEEADLLMSYVPEVLHRDSSNREGHAAKVYFNALFGKSFSRDYACAINAALNYGYSLILSMFNREIVAQGRLTQLGIWHDNTFNYFNLSCDLMELFRPIIDLKVLEMNPQGTEITSEEKHELLKVIEQDVMVNGTNYKLGYAIRVYTMRIIEALDNNLLDDIPVVTYV